MKNSYRVIVNTTRKDRPRDFEMSAALIMAEYFRTDIEFMRPIALKSPDLLINGQVWEIKSPTGSSKNTIYNNIRNARKQSLNLAIDLRRCKLQENKAISNIKYCYQKRKRKVGRYIIIGKTGKVIDLSDIF